MNHGTRSCYHHNKCRCEPCSQANRSYRAKWEIKNKERSLAMAAAYKKANPAKYAQYTAKRKALLLGVEVNDFTLDEWQALLTEHEHRCFYCKETLLLERDHIIPLSKGGNNTKTNIVPACRSCNASKGAKTVEVFSVPTK